MRDKLYREFEHVCTLFYDDLERFVNASEAEVKPMLYDDLQRLTPLAEGEYGKPNQVFIKQIRRRLPPPDISHALWDRLIWDCHFAEALIDKLDNYKVAKKVVTELQHKARIVIEAIDASGWGAWDEMDQPFFQVP